MAKLGKLGYDKKMERVYWFFAVFGTIFFLLRLIAMAVGGMGAEDMDADADVDADVDADMDAESDHHGSDAAFKLFSIQSMTGFCMMFGWIGLAAYKQFSLGSLVSLVIATAAGLFTMYVIAVILRALMSLTTKGAAFSTKDVVGSDATVYLKIPAEGRGKIKIFHDGMTRFIEAVSEESKEIDSFKPVHIVRAMDEGTVSVRVKQ